MGANGSLAADFIFSVAPTAANRAWSFNLAGSALGGTSNFASTVTGVRFRSRTHNRNSQSSQLTTGFTGISGSTSAGGTYYRTINTAVDQIMSLTLAIYDAVSNFMILEAFSMQVEYAA